MLECEEFRSFYIDSIASKQTAVAALEGSVPSERLPVSILSAKSAKSVKSPSTALKVGRNHLY